MSPLRFCCFLAANSLYPHNKKKPKTGKPKKPKPKKPKKPILGNSWKWLIISPYIEKFLKIGFFCFFLVFLVLFFWFFSFWFFVGFGCVWFSSFRHLYSPAATPRGGRGA